MFIYSPHACTFCVVCVIDQTSIIDNHCNFAVSDSFSSHISHHLLETHSSAFYPSSCSFPSFIDSQTLVMFAMPQQLAL